MPSTNAARIHEYAALSSPFVRTSDYPLDSSHMYGLQQTTFVYSCHIRGRLVSDPSG